MELAVEGRGEGLVVSPIDCDAQQSAGGRTDVDARAELREGAPAVSARYCFVRIRKSGNSW